MRYGELHQLLVRHGRHQVWRLRQEGLPWEAIAERLGISGEKARAWYLKWSHDLEREYRETWGERTIRVAIAGDELRVLSTDSQTGDTVTAFRRQG